MTSLDEVFEEHMAICSEARSLVKVKGADYNREKQLNGDTLFNLKVSTLLGLTNSPTQALLVRIIDKIMRLISLTTNAETNPEVKDESVRDTIKDTINYLVYLFVMYKEMKENKIFTKENVELIRQMMEEETEYAESE